MRFEVRAYGRDRISSVLIEALNPDDALRQALHQGLKPMQVRSLEEGYRSWFRKSSSRFDTLLFAQELLALLQAGLSIIEAIEALSGRENQTPSRNVLEQLAARLREGKSLAGALETMPEVFPRLFVGIVRSAERTGNLQEVLSRYIEYRNRIDGLRNKVINAAIYPTLLVTVAIAVTLFLGGYVVPRFAAVYRGTGRSLPWASELLLTWGDFARTHVSLLLLVIAGIGVALAWGWRRLSKRGGLAGLIRKLPLFAEQARIYEVSSLYLSLGMLLDSGLPILAALSLTEEVIPLHQRSALRQVGEAVRIGERLSVALERNGLCTSVGLRLLRVGEESGRLGEMMARTAKFHNEETARWIDRFSRVAEPALMLGIGLVIGTIVILLYMPIFDLAGSLR